MSRSPLFQSLRTAFRVATLASRERPDVPSVDELFEMTLSRRRARPHQRAAGVVEDVGQTVNHEVTKKISAFAFLRVFVVFLIEVGGSCGA